MIDPVNAPDGYTYERAAISKWIKEKGTSPLIPSLRMSKEYLYPARAILATHLTPFDGVDTTTKT